MTGRPTPRWCRRTGWRRPWAPSTSGSRGGGRSSRSSPVGCWRSTGERSSVSRPWGRSRDGDLGPPLELYALYVRQAYWGTGLGHRLLTAAISDAPASLWVLRDNDRARRFSTRHRFVPDGHEKPERLFELVEIRMVRDSTA